MKWRRPGSRKLEEAQEALRNAEALLASAEQQRERVAQIAPRVDAVSSSLQKLRKDNHFGPLIDSILRGSE